MTTAEQWADLMKKRRAATVALARHFHDGTHCPAQFAEPGCQCVNRAKAEQDQIRSEIDSIFRRVLGEKR